MATRPIFIPQKESVGVIEKAVDFDWFPGMAITQKQKSIRELHSTAKNLGLSNILEISSKSENKLGVDLSAFNLIITTKKHNRKFTVETAFQSSKVFERGGPYIDLLGMDSLSAKKDSRLKESGNLIHFVFFGMTFPLIPRTYFYDWLYINALAQNEDLTKSIQHFDGYSDIEFNPKKSINCQAHSVALYVSLSEMGRIDEALESPEKFLSLTSSHYEKQNRTILVQNSFI